MRSIDIVTQTIAINGYTDGTPITLTDSEVQAILTLLAASRSVDDPNWSNYRKIGYDVENGKFYVALLVTT